MKMLGKIGDVSFGSGGYDNVMFGFSFTLHGTEGSFQDFMGTWNREPDEHCKWTKCSQNAYFLTSFNRVREIMKQAKVSDFYKLKGIPIEIEMIDYTLKSWRVLTEVL